MDELKDVDKLFAKLDKTYPTLMPLAATVAVNFSKERFQLGKDVNDIAFKKRENNKDAGRGILVKTGTLKLDVQKISVTEEKAIIGTTSVTSPYAKAHNEGFAGTVTVPAHTRKRTKKVKEQYTDRKGVLRSRTRKLIDENKGDIVVRTFNRKMNLPQRQFLGVSAILDDRIENAIGGKFIQVLNEF